MKKKEMEVLFQKLVRGEISSNELATIIGKSPKRPGRPAIPTQHIAAALAFTWEHRFNKASANKSRLAVAKLFGLKEGDPEKSAKRKIKKGNETLPPSGFLCCFDHGLVLQFSADSDLIYAPSFFLVYGDCWVWEMEEKEAVFYQNLTLYNPFYSDFWQVLECTDD